jgi:hypothetical protein
MAKGKTNGFDCILHDKLKKPPRPPPGNTHDQCKEEYVDEQYGQFDAKKQMVQSHHKS